MCLAASGGILVHTARPRNIWQAKVSGLDKRTNCHHRHHDEDLSAGKVAVESTEYLPMLIFRPIL